MRWLYDLAKAERRCPGCGTARAVLKQQTCEQLDCVPLSLRVIEQVKLTSACPRCERPRSQTPAAVSAPSLPSQPTAQAMRPESIWERSA
jgi:transposase